MFLWNYVGVEIIKNIGNSDRSGTLTRISSLGDSSPKLGGHISAQGAEDELKNNQKVHIISEKLQGGNGKKSETYILPMTASVAATGTCVESTQPPKNPNPPGRSRLSAIVGHF